MRFTSKRPTCDTEVYTNISWSNRFIKKHMQIYTKYWHITLTLSNCFSAQRQVIHDKNYNYSETHSVCLSYIWVATANRGQHLFSTGLAPCFPDASLDSVRLQCFVQGHFGRRPVGVRPRTADPSVDGQSLYQLRHCRPHINTLAHTQNQGQQIWTNDFSHNWLLCCIILSVVL